MAKNKLFVGGLNWGTNEDGLREAFEQFGTLTQAQVVTDRDSGRSRGFGFVTFVEADDAQKAMQEMDGKNLEGRTVRVNEAHERKDGRRGGRF